MNDRDFLVGLDLADRKVREAARRGLGKAGIALMNMAVMNVPRVPIDEGTLRGSGSVHVNGTLLATSPNVGGKPTPNTSPLPRSGAEMIEATVGFNTPYAAHLHEHPEYDFTDSRSGGKYLETKMNSERDKLMSIAANEIRKVTQ
jgi:hypothetical protein